MIPVFFIKDHENVLSFCFSGLLNLNGPQRDRPLLANSEDSEDGEVDPRDEERAATSQSSTSMEQHFIEHLPPTLHKGDAQNEHMRGGAGRRIFVFSPSGVNVSVSDTSLCAIKKTHLIQPCDLKQALSHFRNHFTVPTLQEELTSRNPLRNHRKCRLTALVM